MSLMASNRARAGERAGGAGVDVALAVAGERLRAERDSAMRGAHRHGVPIASIARMMKMSIQGVSRIVGADDCL
jgi:hypothetical protein